MPFGLIGTMLTNRSIAQQNRASEAYADKSYDKERGDALSDWERQNAYNSPAAGMQRLKDAGINKMLGVTGGADTGQASAVQKTTQREAQFKPSKYDNLLSGVEIFDKIQDIRVKKQTVSNLEADNTIKINQALLEYARIQTEGDKKDSIQADVRWKQARNINSQQWWENITKQLMGNIRATQLSSDKKQIELDFFKRLPAGTGGDLMKAILSSLLK